MGRLLGIDYGSKRVGLAVTDELQMLASPLEVLQNDASLFSKLKKIHELYRFEKVVLGYPYSEKYQEAVLAVEAFSTALKKELGLEVVFQNEEFTSVYAESFLKSTGMKQKKIKSNLDKFAAQKILQDYLKLSSSNENHKSHA